MKRYISFIFLLFLSCSNEPTESEIFDEYVKNNINQKAEKPVAFVQSTGCDGCNVSALDYLNKEEYFGDDAIEIVFVYNSKMLPELFSDYTQYDNVYLDSMNHFNKLILSPYSNVLIERKGDKIIMDTIGITF